MNAPLVSFEVGELYSNEEIYRSLAVGNAGGVRARLDRSGQPERMVIMTSVPSVRQLNENPYSDRIEDDVLIYTGTGREGDQHLSGANARIAQQEQMPFPIFGFVQVASRRSSSLSSKRWCFLGLLDFIRCYREFQIDLKGAKRSVWIFELRILSHVRSIHKDAAEALMKEFRSNCNPVDAYEREVVSSANEITPAERMIDFSALEAIRRQLLTFEPRQFEIFLKDLLIRSGFDQVEVTRYSQDGGIDVNAVPGLTSWPIRNLLVQLQAKRWLHTVGRKEVAELRGSLQPHAAGCIVTTSRYSRAALAEATAQGKIPINLIDGHQLAGLVSSLGVVVNE